MPIFDWMADAAPFLKLHLKITSFSFIFSIRGILYPKHPQGWCLRSGIFLKDFLNHMGHGRSRIPYDKGF
jgi:hypothetical protein